MEENGSEKAYIYDRRAKEISILLGSLAFGLLLFVSLAYEYFSLEVLNILVALQFIFFLVSAAIHVRLRDRVAILVLLFFALLAVVEYLLLN